MKRNWMNSGRALETTFLWISIHIEKTKKNKPTAIWKSQLYEDYGQSIIMITLMLLQDINEQNIVDVKNNDNTGKEILASLGTNTWKIYD